MTQLPFSILLHVWFQQNWITVTCPFHISISYISLQVYKHRHKSFFEISSAQIHLQISLCEQQGWNWGGAGGVPREQNPGSHSWWVKLPHTFCPSSSPFSFRGNIWVGKNTDSGTRLPDLCPDPTMVGTWATWFSVL